MRHAVRTLTLLIAASVLPAVQAQFTVRPFAGVSAAAQTGFVDLEQTAGDLKAA